LKIESASSGAQTDDKKLNLRLRQRAEASGLLRIVNKSTSFCFKRSKIGSHLTSANKLTDGGEKSGIKEKSSCTFLKAKKKGDNK